MPQNDQLFEERALKKLQSPELLDQSVSFINIPAKLAIVSLASLASFGLLWSIFGRVPEQVVGQTIFLDLVNTYEIQTTTPGLVIYNTSLFSASRQDELKEFGDIDIRKYFNEIAYFASASNELRMSSGSKEQALQSSLRSFEDINESKLNSLFSTSLSLLQSATIGGYGARKPPIKLNALTLNSDSTVAFVINAEELQNAVTAFATLRKSYNDYQTAIQQNARLIDLAHQNKKYLRSNLEATKQAYNIGVVSRLSIESSVNDLAQADSSIVNSKGQISQAANNFLEAYAQFVIALSAFVQNGSVDSPSDNVVLETLSVNNGDYMPAGTRIAVGEKIQSTKQKPSTIRVFFENSDGQRISPGQLAIVTPSIVQRSEYGGIIGHVVSKPAPLMSSQELDAMSTYEGFNKALLDLYKAPVSVIVKLERDPKGNYKWSGNLTPPYLIRHGTTATANITTYNKPPIQYLVPFFRTLTGGGRDH